MIKNENNGAFSRDLENETLHEFEDNEVSFVKNLRINTKIIKKIISFSLISLAAVIYIKGGTKKLNNNYKTNTKNSETIISKEDAIRNLNANSKVAIYYKKWINVSNNKYIREVHTYDFSKLSDVELREFLETEDLSILDKYEDMHTVFVEEKENLSLEEINKDAYFITDYRNTNPNIRFAITLLITILGGNILFTTGSFIKHKIDYMNLEKELLEGMGYELSYEKNSKNNVKVLKKI